MIKTIVKGILLIPAIPFFILAIVFGWPMWITWYAWDKILNDSNNYQAIFSVFGAELLYIFILLSVFINMTQ